MTTAQLEAKIDNLIANMTPALKEKCMQLARSGGEDVAGYPDNFELPKILFVAALEYEATQYDNGTKQFKRKVRNLRHF